MASPPALSVVFILSLIISILRGNLLERINLKYAKKILEYYRDGDIIWVHDYQLLLVPNLIRQKKPNAIIGFFLHIPFPSFEIFRLLPARFRMEFDEVRKLLQDFTSLELKDKKREFRSEVY